MPKTATIEQLVRRSGNREGSGYGGVTAEADVVPENKRHESSVMQFITRASSAGVDSSAPSLSASKHEYTMNYHLYFVVLGFQLAFTTVLVIAGLVYVLIQTDWLTFRV